MNKNKNLREIAQKAISQAKAEGLSEEDAYWMAAGAVNREAREQGVIGEELTPEMNATSQEVVKKAVGRPRKGDSVRISVTRKFSPELIKAMERVTTNQSEFIEEWMWEHPQLKGKREAKNNGT